MCKHILCIYIYTYIYVYIYIYIYIYPSLSPSPSASPSPSPFSSPFPFLFLSLSLCLSIHLSLPSVVVGPVFLSSSSGLSLGLRGLVLERDFSISRVNPGAPIGLKRVFSESWNLTVRMGSRVSGEDCFLGALRLKGCLQASSSRVGLACGDFQGPHG